MSSQLTREQGYGMYLGLSEGKTKIKTGLHALYFAPLVLSLPPF